MPGYATVTNSPPSHSGIKQPSSFLAHIPCQWLVFCGSVPCVLILAPRVKEQHLRRGSLMVKQKEQENWQKWVTVLAEFCLKPTCVISAHILLAGVGDMAKLDPHQWDAKTMPPGWRTESYMEGWGTTGNVQGKKCVCVYVFIKNLLIKEINK